MRYFLLGSLFLCLFAACAPSKNVVGAKGVKGTHTPFWTMELRDTTLKNDFRLLLSTPKADITGIFIVKKINNAWRGTIINEFGIKVFDFVSTSKKCELMNVISFVDKGYIKKVIASDIQFIMEIDNPDYNHGIQSNRELISDTFTVNFRNKKEIKRFPDGEIKYKNKKRALNYTLHKITTNDTD